MSVYDPEPKVPVGDLGHGLSLGGLLLVIWAIVISIWIPPRLRTGHLVTDSIWVLFIGGIVLMIWGHFRRRTDTDDFDHEEVLEKSESTNRRDAA
ncbi:MAG: hypothetical protein JWO13_1339 [Acidobacteriales bacterium]|nr:hypothetical protein [Terriglobales bacterium]